MGSLKSRSKWIVGMVLGGAVLLLAQEWQTVTNLAGVDFSGLAPARKTLALKAHARRIAPAGAA
ncbi:MAG: hypothetical protein NTW28_17320 [Candidatus Solibacter sp.]|nr:hypothetical protein [Candidatus Solibacter sp.]MCX6924083.1 hypothetical protein [Verrucomicrobiota bacterium]